MINVGKILFNDDPDNYDYLVFLDNHSIGTKGKCKGGNTIVKKEPSDDEIQEWGDRMFSILVERMRYNKEDISFTYTIRPYGRCSDESYTIGMIITHIYDEIWKVEIYRSTDGFSPWEDMSENETKTDYILYTFEPPIHEELRRLLYFPHYYKLDLTHFINECRSYVMFRLYNLWGIQEFCYSEDEVSFIIEIFNDEGFVQYPCKDVELNDELKNMLIEFFGQQEDYEFEEIKNIINTSKLMSQFLSRISS